MREQCTMPVTPTKLARPKPVHFRIRGVGPHPLDPPLSAPGQLLLDIEYLNYPAAPSWPIMPDELEPHREAVEAAIRSGQVYWVDWSERVMPMFQPSLTLPERLLRAVSAGQMVPNEQP